MQANIKDRILFYLKSTGLNSVHSIQKKDVYL